MSAFANIFMSKKFLCNALRGMLNEGYLCRIYKRNLQGTLRENYSAQRQNIQVTSKQTNCERSCIATIVSTYPLMEWFQYGIALALRTNHKAEASFRRPS